jgi:hypothetical protein
MGMLNWQYISLITIKKYLTDTATAGQLFKKFEIRAKSNKSGDFGNDIFIGAITMPELERLDEFWRIKIDITIILKLVSFGNGNRENSCSGRRDDDSEGVGDAVAE